MSIATEITRIDGDKTKIKNKLVALGLTTSVANLDTCADAIAGIVDNGGVSAKITEGQTYTIPAGYHNGSGTVIGIAGGGDYNLQSKTITPTKEMQTVTPDEGNYGLSDVTVNAIPDNYQDITSVTATAPDVLANKIIVTADGKKTAGTMVNNGAVSKTLDASNKTYTVPTGYHNGKGTVSITTESKTATPTKSQQTITPAPGSVIDKVVIDPIPAEFISTTEGTALAGDILTGKVAFVKGLKVEGEMPDNGTTSLTIDGMVTTTASVPAGYTSGGTVTLTDTVENALAVI